MRTDTVLLVAERIEKTYPLRDQALTALAPTSFQIAVNTTVAVIGPSGSGKSTLAAILAGWEQPTGGLILHPQGTPTVAFVPQRYPLFESLTIGDNIRIAAPDDTEGLRDTAIRLGVDHLLDRYPTEASLGEEQRIAVARALHSRPQLLILDEPSSHQDARNTELLIAAITAPPPDSAVVVTTHDPALTALFPDQVHLTRASQVRTQR